MGWSRWRVKECGLALLDNPPFARSAKDGPPGFVEAPGFVAQEADVLDGGLGFVAGWVVR